MARSKSRSGERQRGATPRPTRWTCAAAAADALDLRGAVELALGDLDCPVLVDLDIGHQPPQLSLVNGALAEVHYADGGGWVRQRWG